MRANEDFAFFTAMQFTLPSNSCYCCCSAAKSRLTLCDPMDCRCQAFLSFTIFLSLLKPMSIELVMLSNHLILWDPRLPLPSIFPASESFPMSRLFTSGGQTIGASASSVLPINIQGWFPLGLTGLISLLSKEISRVFSSTTVQKQQFFGAPPSELDYKSNSHICTGLLEKP